MSRARPVGNGGGGPVIHEDKSLVTDEPLKPPPAASTSPRRGVSIDPNRPGFRK